MNLKQALLRKYHICAKYAALYNVMGTHAVIKKSIVDMVSVALHSAPEHGPLMALSRYLDKTEAGPELTETFKSYLIPASTAISAKSVSQLATLYPDAKIAELARVIPAPDQDSLWYGCNVTIMLMNTVSMMPPQMQGMFENFTGMLMNGMNQGGGAGGAGGDPMAGLASLMGMMGAGGASKDEDSADDDGSAATGTQLSSKKKRHSERKRPKTSGNSRVDKARQNLC